MLVMTDHIANIEKVFALVDKVDYIEGLSTYNRHQVTIRKIAEHYNFGFVQAVAAFVSLSPNNSQMGNYRSLVSIMKGLNEGVNSEAIKIATYNHCKNRAILYLTGEADFLMETKGPKIISFYYNIIQPENPRYITIDGHIYSIWKGKRHTVKAVAMSRWEKSYNEIAKDFFKVAKKNNLTPCQLQAMLWFTWKRINKVLYSPQMNLLVDQWNIDLNPETIQPF
jgi:hypothetical protein